MRIRTHTNPFYCRQRFEKLKNLEIEFDYQNKLDFEIGFGRGEFICDYALQNPDRFIIGIDVRKKTVELLQEKLALLNITNVYAVHGNGLICLQDMFDDQSINNIFIFHPDPWEKRRHNNRRVVNNELLDVAKNKLLETGKIHISTDVESLWKNITKVVAVNQNFVKVKHSNFWEKFYKTRWNEISQEKQRKTFYATFCFKDKMQKEISDNKCYEKIC